MVKRSQRAGPPKPVRQPEPKPQWTETHSGEGSASALETLQKLEKRRVARTLPEPPPGGETEE